MSVSAVRCSTRRGRVSVKGEIIEQVSCGVLTWNDAFARRLSKVEGFHRLSAFLFLSDHAPTTGPEHPKTNHRAPHATPHPYRPFQTMGNVPRNGRGTRPLAAARLPAATPPRRLCPPGTLAEPPWAWCELT